VYDLVDAPPGVKLLRNKWVLKEAEDTRRPHQTAQGKTGGEGYT
jgi:hypothetical protein